MKRLLSSLVLASLAPAAPAAADDLALAVHAEGGLGVMLTDVYRRERRFDLGGGGTLRVGLEVAGPLLELRLSGGAAWFPVEAQDPGTLFSLGIGARSTIRLDEHGLPALGGPFFDLDVMLGVTGDLVRPALDVGVGWAFFLVEEVTLGPVVRYTLVIQDPGAAIADPASLLFVGLDFGLRFGLGGTETVVVEAPPPEPDEDGDGVRGDADRCPAEAEDVDGFDDADGCPELDDDSDGYPDEEDVCPRLPETRNGFDDADGCPDDAPPPEVEVRVVPHGTEGTPLPHHVYFRVGSPRVSPRYADEIRAVCALMTSQPAGTRLRVIGHADEQGTQAANHRLGAERAGAVAEQLVLCGVDPMSIESMSYGDSRPACSETTEECRELRRRVEFELVAAPE